MTFMFLFALLFPLGCSNNSASKGKEMKTEEEEGRGRRRHRLGLPPNQCAAIKID